MRFDLGPRIGRQDRDLLRHCLSMATGTAVEFGVGDGGSLAVIAAHMPAIGFGNTTGLPEDWRNDFPAGSLAFAPPVIDNATVVVGDFDQTLPGFDWPTDIGLIHFDADLYSSTACALNNLPPITAGTFVVFDEWHGYDSCENHEQRAWAEYVDRVGIDWDVIGHGREQWAIRIKETA